MKKILIAAASAALMVGVMGCTEREYGERPGIVGNEREECRGLSEEECLRRGQGTGIVQPEGERELEVEGD